MRRCCYVCKNYWTLWGEGCHANGNKYDEAGFCFEFKRKEEKKEPDAQELYEKYMEEWN